MPSFRSTKGASKQRRDQINDLITQLRSELPFSDTTKQRLSQLQVMSLVSSYIRSSNFLNSVASETSGDNFPSFLVEEALSQSHFGFLIIVDTEGKFLHVSDNVSQHLGLSTVDLLAQSDSLFDVVRKCDHTLLQHSFLRVQEHAKLTPSSSSMDVSFVCHMKFPRSQNRGGRDYRPVLVRGHPVFLTPKALASFTKYIGNQASSASVWEKSALKKQLEQPIFAAVCKPIPTADLPLCQIEDDTDIFFSVHSYDMRFRRVSSTVTSFLGHDPSTMLGKSWYEFLHPHNLSQAEIGHSEAVSMMRQSFRGGTFDTNTWSPSPVHLSLRYQTAAGMWINCYSSLHARPASLADPGFIVVVNYVLRDCEVPLIENSLPPLGNLPMETSPQTDFFAPNKSAASTLSPPADDSFGFNLNSQMYFTKNVEKSFAMYPAFPPCQPEVSRNKLNSTLYMNKMSLCPMNTNSKNSSFDPSCPVDMKMGSNGLMTPSPMHFSEDQSNFVQNERPCFVSVKKEQFPYPVGSSSCHADLQNASSSFLDPKFAYSQHSPHLNVRPACSDDGKYSQSDRKRRFSFQEHTSPHKYPRFRDHHLHYALDNYNSLPFSPLKSFESALKERENCQDIPCINAFDAIVPQSNLSFFPDEINGNSKKLCSEDTMEVFKNIEVAKSGWPETHIWPDFSDNAALPNDASIENLFNLNLDDLVHWDIPNPYSQKSEESLTDLNSNDELSCMYQRLENYRKQLLLRQLS